MVRRRAYRGVPQSVADRAQLPDLLIKQVRPGRQHRPVHPGATFAVEHPTDLLERKSRRPSQCDRGQLLEHAGVILSSEPTAPG